MKNLIEFPRLAHSVQFGSNCEVVVMTAGKDRKSSPLRMDVTGRRIGDGPSQIVLEFFICKTEDAKNGKILKSIQFYDDSDKIIFFNYEFFNACYGKRAIFLHWYY